MDSFNHMRRACRPSTVVWMLACVSVHAQVLAADGPAVRILPRVSVTQTWTDNVRLSTDSKQADQITEVAPGVTLTIAGDRLRAYVDYALNEIYYAQGSSPRRSQNLLNGFGTLEAVEGWAYLDFNASISQQALSAFGPQSISNTAVNPNQAEVSSYRISPYVRGKLGSWADYDARYSRIETDSDAAAASKVVAVDSMVKIKGDSSFRNLGWSADASSQQIEYSAGRSTQADRLNLGLSYALSPQLSVSANMGRESDNFTSPEKQSDGTHGFGVSWAPSERTRVSVSRGQRPFGTTHALNLEHRTARTVWRFTDSKDVAATPSQSNATGFGSVYDLLFSQFAALEPRVDERARLVNAFLRDNGIKPDLGAINSFLTSAVFVQRRQDALFALLGVRDTITFVGTRSDSRRLDLVSLAVDDLSTSSLIRQQGLSVNWAHRLTPDYSLGVLVSGQKTSGSLGLQSTRLQLLNASLSGRVGRRALATVGLRHVVSRGNVPYDETAINFNLTVQF
jgi:uncharacterized protein (PEP-CTERM system associated)